MLHLKHSSIFDEVRSKLFFLTESYFTGSRTTPHEDNSPPDKNIAQPLPTRTTIPRTIPHQDNPPLGPLPRNKTTHQDQNLYGEELSSWRVVRIRTLQQTGTKEHLTRHTFCGMLCVVFASMHFLWRALSYTLVCRKDPNHSGSLLGDPHITYCDCQNLYSSFFLAMLWPNVIFCHDQLT